MEQGYPLKMFRLDKLKITVSIGNCKKAVHVSNCKKAVHVPTSREL